MKISKMIRVVSIFMLTSLLSTVVLAADSFFEIGKTYLFTPRMNIVMKGTVTQITNNEIVFTNRYILKASKASAAIKNDDAKLLPLEIRLPFVSKGDKSFI